MGAALGSGDNAGEVVVHIYDVSSHRIVEQANQWCMRAMGTGAFHAAVEVYGQEWSFGYINQGSGVFSCPPRSNELHRYRKDIPVGATKITKEDFEGLIEKLSRRWLGRDYDLLHRNCCHFCSELCDKLGVEPLPAWVTNLAGAGATLDRGFQQAVQRGTRPFDTAAARAILTAAKTGKIDLRYQHAAPWETKAADILVSLGELRSCDCVPSFTEAIQQLGWSERGCYTFTKSSLHDYPWQLLKAYGEAICDRSGLCMRQEPPDRLALPSSRTALETTSPSSLPSTATVRIQPDFPSSPSPLPSSPKERIQPDTPTGPSLHSSARRRMLV